MTISSTTIEELSEKTNTIEELEAILSHVVLWHETMQDYLKTMAEIPSGTSFSVDDAAPIVLEGDAHQAFQAGIHVALAAIDVLPFRKVSLEEENSVDH